MRTPTRKTTGGTKSKPASDTRSSTQKQHATTARRSGTAESNPSGRYDVAVVGLGYVGLPLCVAFARKGMRVLGFDVDAAKVERLNGGASYIRHIGKKDVRAVLDAGGRATASPADLSGADAILICVPTPLTKNREPDMRFVRATGEMLAGVVRKGQLVVLESTTYPGTTREVLLPALEASGLKAGRDFNLAYSPEREDPGSAGHSAPEIPKVVGGLTRRCLERAERLYQAVVPRTVPVSSLEAAEATKLMENIFRCVNIALVNELKLVFDRMGIDIWEVVNAAKSKPFGFMPCYPGPGRGGHCIPIDPFYLTWKAREFDCSTRFIELAGVVNVAMPEYVVERTADALNDMGKCLKGSRVLLLGMAYKKGVDDIRESPSLKLMELFEKAGARVDYHDPFVPKLHKMRRYDYRKQSVPLDAKGLAKYAAVVIATDHDEVDYRLVGERAKLVVDTRNAMARVGRCRAVVRKA